MKTIFILTIGLALIGLSAQDNRIKVLDARVRCEKAQAENLATYDSYIAQGGAAVSDPRGYCQYLEDTGRLLAVYPK